VTGLFFEPGDPKDLADKMKLLWENSELCWKITVAGRKQSANTLRVFTTAG